MGSLLQGLDWHMYGQHEPTYITMEASELHWLLKAEAILDALMSVGIHTHERFDEAMRKVNNGETE